VLRHDKTLQHATQIQPHLKHIPDYILPRGLAVADSRLEPKAAKGKGAPGKKAHKGQKRKASSDPLKSFEYKKRGAKGGASA
jgi:ATP-dependent RNA helicase DDX56/DBP9